jgi:hypothetical protein
MSTSTQHRTGATADGAEDDDNAHGSIDEDDAHEDSLVRPYTLTKGRTRNEGLDVAIQAVVCQSRSSGGVSPPVGPIELEIWQAAGERLSSADISARLDLPLGVVRVLVGDLTQAGHVELGVTVATGDARLLRRLIDGVRAI